MRLLLIALIAISSVVAGRVEAYPPTSGCSFTTNNGSCPGPYSTTGAAVACYLANNVPSAGSPPGGGYSFYDWGTGPNLPFVQSAAPSCGGVSIAYPWFFNGSYVGAQGVNATTGDTCPNGGTLTGGNCVCASGYTDTGTACVVDDCPAAGTAMGVRDMTVGWALSATPDADDWVGGFQSPGSSQCVTHGSGHCTATVDYANSGAQAGANFCWRAQTPEPTGLYRVSCDYPLVAAGSGACSPDPNAASSPSATAPTCPGTSGTFNGRPICLGVAGNAVQTPKPEEAGNPRAGTSPIDDSNSGREPQAPTGGPDARGGPGVTVGPGGSIGTGNNRAPGTGTGDAPEFPDDYNREVTQQAILNKLGTGVKVDETGTPDGTEADTEAKNALNTEAGKLTTGLEGIIAGTNAPDRSWGFGISFPSTCNPTVIGTARWGFFEVDFCQWQSIAHDIMALVWIGATLFLCIGMVFRAISAG